MFQHSADVGAWFSRHVFQFWALTDRFHNGIGTSSYINARCAPGRKQFDISGGYRTGFNVARGRFHYHC
ncbi:Uncharacterised protein [Shigella sonnei]|nr:Uncharacterised protein [Shigella sonnei]CSP72353.1 Uncharacterised protein [Shigella sonnei]